MNRLVQIVVLLSMLVLAVLPAPAVARADSCQTLLPKGLWEGTTHVLMDVRGIENGVLLQEFVFNHNGQIALTVDCGVSAGTYHATEVRTIDYFFSGGHVECNYVYDLKQATGSVVAGSNGQPRLDVRWGQGSVTSPCIEGNGMPAATWQFSVSGPPQDRTVKGDFHLRYDDPQGQDWDALAQMFRSQGYQVTLDKSFTLTRKPQPTVEGLSASLRQFFLAGIPVTNHYTAAIDWDGADPGSASFILEGNPPANMSVNASGATFDLPLGPIQRTGDIPISVEAEIEGRLDRRDGLGPLTMVPVPNWAKPFNLQPQPQAEHVGYKGELRLPDKPLDAHVELPALIPFVGGTWGLLPTQFKVGLSADSLGTRERDGISAQGGFGLGKRVFKLAASGNVFGTITHDELKFESDPLTLSTSGIFFQEHIGLLSVIPDVEALFSVPVLGDALKALNSALGVTADVHGSMAGHGRLGVTGDKLGLTEAGFDAGLGVTASAGIDTPVVTLILTGGGDGSLSMQVIPAVKVTACKVLLSFQARAGAFGFNAPPAKAQFSILTCTVGGQTVLVSADPQALAAVMTYGSSVPLIERSVSEAQTTNGLPETVLVENTSLQARPLLVAGADGRLALVWNSVSASGAADAVSLRLYDGAVWGNAITVSQAGRASFNPTAVFAAGGNLLVAWSEAQGAPDPNGITEAFVRSLEIVWVEIDPGTGQVVHSGRLTTDSVMDFAPRLSAAADGTVWLAWQRSPGSNMAGTAAAPNWLQASRWTGSGWTTVEMAGQNGVGTLFWDIAAVDGDRVWLVADVDMDGDMGTAADREISVYKRTISGWATPYRLTNDSVIDSGPLLTLRPDGKPVLAWRHGDEVLGLIGDPTSTPPQTWFGSNAGVGPMLGSGRLLAGAGGKLVLLWPEGTEKGQDVWLSRYDPNAKTWSQPGPLFQSAEQRRSLSATLKPGGDILLGLEAATVKSESVNFGGGATGNVPVVDDAGRLLVATIPAGYVPAPQHPQLFMPVVVR